MNIYTSHNIVYLIRREKWDNETFGSKFNVSGSSVSTYKTGKATPKIETLIRIASYFDITLDQLVLYDLEYGDFPTALNKPTERRKKDTTTLNVIDKEETIKHLEKTIELQDKLIHAYECQIDDLSKTEGDNEAIKTGE